MRQGSGVLALTAIAVAFGKVTDAAGPGGIFYFCTDCGVNSTMTLRCNGTDLFGDGNYKGDGKFTLSASIAGIPIMRVKGPSMCGQDTKVLLPGGAGELLVHGLDDCTGTKPVHWNGIDAVVDPAALPGGTAARVHLETESDHLLCVDVTVKKIPDAIDDDTLVDDDFLARRRHRQHVAGVAGRSEDESTPKVDTM